MIKINSIYNVPVIIKHVPEEHYFARLIYETGSEAHLKYLQKRASNLGLLWDKNGLSKGGRYLVGKSEEDIYSTLNLPFVPPELREDNALFRADVLEVPALVEIKAVSYTHLIRSLKGTAVWLIPSSIGLKSAR